MKKRAQAEYKGLTKYTQELLNKPEGIDVEFKRNIKGVEATDLVAFANSENGGTILIGINDIQTEGGRQRGELLGCAIGDSEKLTILNKAEDCVPPVEISIFFENTGSSKPIMRLEIPSGSHKPYCTKQGIYKIRGDGRTIALLPNRLLNLFIETEGIEFINRFQGATKGLEETLDEVTSKIEKRFSNFQDYIDGMEKSIRESLNGVFDSANNTEQLSDEATASASEALGYLIEMMGKVDEINEVTYRSDLKLYGILNNFNIEDPWLVDLRQSTKLLIKTYLKHEPNIKSDEILLRLIEFSQINQFELRKWIDEVIAETADSHS